MNARLIDWPSEDKLAAFERIAPRTRDVRVFQPDPRVTVDAPLPYGGMNTITAGGSRYDVFPSAEVINYNGPSAGGAEMIEVDPSVVEPNSWAGRAVRGMPGDGPIDVVKGAPRMMSGTMRIPAMVKPRQAAFTSMEPRPLPGNLANPDVWRRGKQRQQMDRVDTERGRREWADEMSLVRRSHASPAMRRLLDERHAGDTALQRLQQATDQRIRETRGAPQAVAGPTGVATWDPGAQEWSHMAPAGPKITATGGGGVAYTDPDTGEVRIVPGAATSSAKPTHAYQGPMVRSADGQTIGIWTPTGPDNQGYYKFRQRTSQYYTDQATGQSRAIGFDNLNMSQLQVFEPDANANNSSGNGATNTGSQAAGGTGRWLQR